jgi:hypothetical protein
MISFRGSPAITGLTSLWLSVIIGVVTAQAQDHSGVVLENPLAVHSLDLMSATRERPLFSPSRRLPPPPPQPVARLPVITPPPPPPNVVLFGTVLEADEARAVVRVAPKNEIIRVRIGEEIEGWKVTQIERRQLVLSLDDRSATFTLFGGQVPNSTIGHAALPGGKGLIPNRAQPPGRP